MNVFKLPYWQQVKSLGSSALKVAALTSFVLGLTHCSFKTPEGETPAPTDKEISKGFFVSKNQNKSKTFLCGWASVSAAGFWGKRFITHNYQRAEHCNIQFKITEDALIGVLINPSFPDEPDRWTEMIRIPITKHYYLEKARDSRGRTTNDTVENSSRSMWDARPYMKLAFSSTQIMNKSYGVLWGGSRITSVDDIEMTEHNGKSYLAFTANVTSSIIGSEYQGRFRFNFLEFDHDPSFQPVAYSDRNAKFLNVLHVMGKKHDGVYQALSAAHWKLDPENPQEIYLHGFPEEYVPIAEDVIKEWNIAFTQVFEGLGNYRSNYKKYLKLVTDVEHEYAFDLRYPTIKWISDKEISMYGPLGIGMAQADVLNGQIKWGGVSIFGGMIERYLKRFLPTDSTGEVSSQSMTQLHNLKLPKESIQFIQEMSKADGLHQDFMAQMGFNDPVGLDGMIGESLGLDLNVPDNQRKINQYTAFLMQDAQKEFSQMLRESQRVSRGFSWQSLMGYQPIPLRMSQEPSTTPVAPTPIDPTELRTEDITAGVESLDQNTAFAWTNGHTQDLDRRFIDIAGSWLLEMSNRENNLDYVTGMRRIVKELLLHEVGHMLGLGHQFKENIVPKDGTVPAKYIDGFADGDTEAERQGLKALATKEKGFTNTTSVMGYRDPRSEILTTYEDMKPGIQDILSLRYIYRGEYPTYKDEASTPDFKFASVPGNGIIPEADPENPEYKTAFMPTCNDYEATLGVDPYCNRFDRGNKAGEIVDNYFVGIKDNIVTTLFSFTNQSGTSSWSREGYLWYKAMRILGRVRIFYDYMRQKPEFQPLIRKIAEEEQNLLDFYDTCTGASRQNSLLVEIFDDPANAEFKELCQVNGRVIEEYEKIMSLTATDYTRYDFDSYVYPGGLTGGDVTTDWSRFMGTWQELTAIPLKIMSLYNLTTVRPFVAWYFGPIPRYADPSALYTYASLYPLQYTKALSSAVANNLRDGSSAESETTVVGRLVPSIGAMSFMMYFSNDSLYFPDELLTRIREQSSFNIKGGIVLFKEHYKHNNNSRVTHFSANIYDFQTRSFTPVDSVYMLPGGRFIAKGQGESFILPMGKVKFFGQSKEDKGVAYGYAIVIESEKDRKDRLSSVSVKTELKTLHDRFFDNCINGPLYDNGLSYYFNEENFEGFEYSQNIGGQPLKQDDFFVSIDRAFEKYYSEGISGKELPERRDCTEALRGIISVGGSAALLNGQFFLPVLSVMEKN